MDLHLRPRRLLPTTVLATLLTAVVTLIVCACGLGSGSAQDDPFAHLEKPFDWQAAPTATASASEQTIGQALEDVLTDHAAELTTSRVRTAGDSYPSFSVRLAPHEGMSTDDTLSLVDDLQTAFARNLPAEAVGEDRSVIATLDVIVEMPGLTDVPMALRSTSSWKHSDHDAEELFIDAVRTVDTRGARSVILDSEGLLTLTYPDESSLHEGMAAVTSAPPTAMRSVIFFTETRRWKVEVSLEPEEPLETLPGMVERIVAAHDPWPPQFDNELSLYMKDGALVVGNMPGDTDGPDADKTVDILRAADNCGQTPLILHVGDSTHQTGYVAYTCTAGHLEVNADSVLGSAFTEPANNTQLAAELLEEARR